MLYRYVYADGKEAMPAMKKTLLCALLLLCLMIVPALAEETPALRGYDKEQGYVYLNMGTFPQTAEGEVLPILWRVLSVEEGRAYILSEYILEARPIHSDYKAYANKPDNKKYPGFNGDFAQTEMSQYLNGDFASTRFTAEELSLIAEDEALGRFYLVTAEDLKNKEMGFGTDKTRKGWGTDYAKANGLFVYSRSHGSHSPYWTRDQSTSDARHARCTKAKGNLGRINVITLDEGMRPACKLDLTKVAITGGAGTMEEPFTIAPLALD